MKVTLGTIVIALMCFGTGAPGHAETKFVKRGTLVTVNDAIQKALRDDASVKRAEARLLKEKELYEAVKSRAFPKLTTDLYAAGVTQQDRGVIFWASEIRLPLFEGGRWFHEKRKKSLEVSAAKLSLEAARNSVSYEIKAIYVSLLRERESTMLAQTWEKEAGKLYLAMKALLEKELVSRVDLYRWETVYRCAQAELVKHKTAMDYGESLLRDLTGIPESERIELEGLNQTVSSDLDFTDLFRGMKTCNPLYEIVRLRAKAKEEEIKILRAGRFPRLAVRARFNLARDSYIDQNRFELGVVSSWNIFDFGLSHEIKAKRAEAEETREEGRVETSKLEDDFWKIESRLEIARAKIDAARALVREKKEAYASGKTRLIAAEKSEAEVFDSFVALTQAEMAGIESVAEYRLLRARLEMLAGSGVSGVAKN